MTMKPPKDSSYRPIFSGRIVNLAIEEAELPGGHHCELEIVRHPGGAAAVALDESGRVCLLRQYRHAANGWLWELPAGKLEPDERPLETARRELQEEAGIGAADWTSLGHLHSSPGVFTEVIHLYLARGLRPLTQQLGVDEVLEVHWVDLRQALAWAVDGAITDAKTLVGLFRASASTH